jgi:hypothetical protein
MKMLTHDQLRTSLIVSGIGIMLLFGSKGISNLIFSSYPPSGIISISFMGRASYLLYIGIYNTAKLAARDNQLHQYLRKKVENDLSLLRNIASSEKRIESEKTVKQLLDLSIQWQKDNDQAELTNEEIKENIQDVLLELKRQKKD